MTKSRARGYHEEAPSTLNGGITIISQQKLDPKLSELFSKSSGPVQSNRRKDRHVTTSEDHEEMVGDRIKPDSASSSKIWPEKPESGDSGDDEREGTQNSNADAATRSKDDARGKSTKVPRRKRKRDDDNDDIEKNYMQKLEREEEREHVRRKTEKIAEAAQHNRDGDDARDTGLDSENAEPESKRSHDHDGSSEEDLEATDSSMHDVDEYQVPQHESLAPTGQDVDTEKPLRTVFVGNISTDAMRSKSSKKALLRHFSSFLPELPDETGPHKLESIRFRSTAYSNSMPRKAAYVAKDLMSATTKSTNAYIVYTSKAAAREAAKRLNGTVILDRHVRVDEVAHPAKVDHKRCVFVGNLGYVDDESNMVAAANGNDDGSQEDKQKKTKKTRPPGDVEEGLWRQFSHAGTVESVRVVRDAKTRVGKGFAYVQFSDPNGVEAALLYNEKSFPPLLCRKLRVLRAKAVKRNRTSSSSSSYSTFNNNRRNAAHIDPKLRSMQGRALGMLGRAGAAQVWKQQKRDSNRGDAGITGTTSNDVHRQKLVFEGVRARKEDRVGVKGRKKGKSMSKGKGKDNRNGQGRRRERTTAWKTRSKA